VGEAEVLVAFVLLIRRSKVTMARGFAESHVDAGRTRFAMVGGGWIFTSSYGRKPARGQTERQQ